MRSQGLRNSTGMKATLSQKLPGSSLIDSKNEIHEPIRESFRKKKVPIIRSLRVEGRAPSQQGESPAVGHSWALGDELVSPTFFKGIHALSSLVVSLVSFLGQGYAFREKKKGTSDPFLMSPASDQVKTETASAWILLVLLPPARTWL